MSNDITEKIVDFVNSHKRIFIYGAGCNGKICYSYLCYQGVKVNGFIQTTKSAGALFDIPVYDIISLLPQISQNDGIIISMREELQSEVKQFVRGLDVFYPTDDDIVCLKSYLESNQFFDELRYLSKIVRPCEPVHFSHWKNILVVRLDALGDMVWTMAFLRELRRNCLNAKITVVHRPIVKELLSTCPYIDKQIEYDCPLGDDYLPNKYITIREKCMNFSKKMLIPKNFDVVFLPRFVKEWNIIENLYLALFSGAPNRICRLDLLSQHERSLLPYLRKLFSHVQINTLKKHEVSRILDLLKGIGLQVNDEHLELWPAPINVKETELYMQRYGISRYQHIVAVGLTGSSDNKSWSPKNYADLFEKIERINRGEYVFLILGDKNALLSSEKIRKYKSNLSNVISLVGQTSLGQVLAIMHFCTYYLGSNTGLLHIAAAFQKPIVEISAVFVDGDANEPIGPVRSGAWKTPSIVLQPQSGMDGCISACSKTYSHCINQITVDDVYNALLCISTLDKS